MKDLLRRLKWGIDKGAARNLFPGFQFVGDHPELNGIGLTGEMFGHPAFVVCYFRKRILCRHRLARINIGLPLKRPDDQTCAKIFVDIRSEIATVLNRTPYDMEDLQRIPPEFRASKMSAWRQDRTVIILSLSVGTEAIDASSPPINLGIGDITNDFASQQWTWLEP